jgi:hypothetical protein
MTNHEKILKDLSISQSTADSIAARMKMEKAVIIILLDQLIAKKLVERSSLPLHKDVEVYRLTSNNTIPCSTSTKPEKNSKNSPPLLTTSPAPDKSTSPSEP